MQVILDQVRNYCDCVDDVSDEELLQYITRLIAYLSVATCWKSDTCETFLKSMRRETFKIDKVVWNCCEQGIYKTNLHYPMVDFSNAVLTLVHRNGIKDEEIILSATEFFYSEYLNELRVDLKPYLPNPKCVPCPVDYHLVVEYEAGYDEIPECIMFDFCHILNILLNSDAGCSDCEDCDDYEVMSYGSHLVGKRADGIAYTWKVDDRDVDLRISRLMNLMIFQNLSMLNICKDIRVVNSWGDVINKCRR